MREGKEGKIKAVFVILTILLVIIVFFVVSVFIWTSYLNGDRIPKVYECLNVFGNISSCEIDLNSGQVSFRLQSIPDKQYNEIQIVLYYEGGNADVSVNKYDFTKDYMQYLISLDDFKRINRSLINEISIIPIVQTKKGISYQCNPPAPEKCIYLG